jgi:16S rRNA (cytosine1402-N4)-methyltransferase
MAHAAQTNTHIPVMLGEVLAKLQPTKDEVFVDGTFGAGGYARGILQTAGTRVIAIDRDPTAIAAGQALVTEAAGRLALVHSTFDELEDVLAEQGITKVDGVVFDVGVSSMQIDQADRGFSFMRDGPLDMRMSLAGPTAADHLNRMKQDDIANVIYILGDEPRSRAIARAIVAARDAAPLVTTLDLVRAVEKATGPQRAKDRIHPATKTFQAIRIFVNAELAQLARGLSAAERVLKENGRLVVVTFHSLEDRIVKRFFASRSGKSEGQSRFLPEATNTRAPSFLLLEKGALAAGDDESEINPRARSAKLRVGRRTAAAAWPQDALKEFGTEFGT